MKLESILNIFSSILSIAAIGGGFYKYFEDKKAGKLAKWTGHLSYEFSNNTKGELLKEALADLGSKDLVKTAFIEGQRKYFMYISQCETHFEYLWQRIIVEGGKI